MKETTQWFFIVFIVTNLLLVEATTISNVEYVLRLCLSYVSTTQHTKNRPRRDVNGDLMDIHDGNLFLDPTNTSRFLWFGMG